MLFFQILLDRQEFFEKETALKEEYNYELQINLHVAIVQTKKYGYH